MTRNDFIREMILDDTLKFACYFFKKQTDKTFVIGQHHHIVCNALNKVLRGETKKLIINIAPRYSKCIAPNTRIYTSRGLIDAKDVREGDMLYSFDQGNLVLQRCQGIEDARKQSVRITMRSGRTIECSYDHPMLTTFGYKEASKIEVGERIVAMRSVIDTNYEIPDAELDFVTMMIFDGSCSTMGFSKTDPMVLDIMRNACDKLGFSLIHRPSASDCDYAIHSNRTSASRDLLKKYGIYGKKSYDKRLPKEWFVLSKRQRLRFIDLMFATDGYVSSYCGCGVALANKGLIEDIQHILASLGIISTMCYKPNKCAGAWALTISRAETIKLLDMITFVQKRDKAEKLRGKKAVFITDSFPHKIISHEKLTYKTNKPPYRCASGKEITRDKFIRLSETFPQLKKYIHADFYYDRVDKVEPIGEIDLIHIGVDNTHNFIANGLVSHNTQIAVKSFIAMGLAINPQAKFLHLSYSGDLAQDNSVSIKDIVNSTEYQELFDVRIKKGSDTKSRWDTEQGGGVYATSTLGQITGFGAGLVEDGEGSPFGGAIVIDDPIKPEDALSDNEREKVNRRFETTIRNRVNSRNTPIIIIMQRLHEHDLCGYLQEIEGDDWEVVSLPCIITDENGEEQALWPFKHTLEELKKIEAANSFVFETQYMQNPTPLEGLMYREFKTYEEMPFEKGAIICNYTDVADTGSDYLCSICYEEHKDGLYVTDVLYTQKPIEYTEQAMAQMLTKRKVRRCMVERNNGGRIFMNNVERICREYGNNATQFISYAQKDNKQVKIFNYSNEVNNLVVFPKGWEHRWPEFARDVKGFRKEGRNAHDDAPDALSEMVKHKGKANALSDADILRMLG